MASPHGLFHEGNRHPRQGVYVRFHFEQVFGLLFVEMPRGEPQCCDLQSFLMIGTDGKDFFEEELRQHTVLFFVL